FRKLAQQLVEELHRLRAVALQAFDDLLLRQQRSGLLADLADLLDLLVELVDLGLHVRDVALLLVDLLVEEHPHRAGGEEPDHRDDARQHRELLLAPPALLFAVRKEVDADHEGSNLRIARPQATMREGASIVSWRGLIFEDSAMFANGLATTVCTCVRWFTISSSPSSIALPPVRRMWSTLLNWVEVKKNCSARWISSTIFSLNGCSTSGPKFSGRLPTRFAASASSTGMSNWRAMSAVSALPPICCSRVYTVCPLFTTVTRVTVAPMSTVTVTSASEMPELPP